MWDHLHLQHCVRCQFSILVQTEETSQQCAVFLAKPTATQFIRKNFVQLINSNCDLLITDIRQLMANSWMRILKMKYLRDWGYVMHAIYEVSKVRLRSMIQLAIEWRRIEVWRSVRRRPLWFISYICSALQSVASRINVWKLRAYYHLPDSGASPSKVLHWQRHSSAFQLVHINKTRAVTRITISHFFLFLFRERYYSLQYLVV